MSLSSNVAALHAQRQLGATTVALSNSFERLSSGLRINSAEDDAAGLAIAANLDMDSRVISQAVRNINDGISLLNIADSGLAELNTIVTRLRELASQSATGTIFSKQRGSLDKEAQALSKEFNRIARTTSFIGLALFDGSVGDLSLQAGYSQLASDLGGFIGDGTFGNKQSYAAGASPYSVAVGDFDGDGVPDLATADNSSNTASVLLGRGDGTFAARQTYGVGVLPRSVAVGDFNGDGVQDLATADFGSDVATVLLGRGDGTFGNKKSYAAGASPYSVAVGDFDGDGVQDLVTADYGSNTASVLLGRGDGTFGAKQSYGVGSVPYSVAVGDFNGDGIQDLVTADQNSNTASVLLGRGDGTFGVKQSYIAGAFPRFVAVGDFNGDGIHDLVTANTGSNTASVLLGRGDGTFGVKQSYIAGAFPRFVAVGDFNGDGIQDLVTADQNSNSASVLLGQGDGTFGARQSYATGTSPRSVAVGDFNGDGVQDLAATGGGGVNVLTANTLHGVSALQSFSLATRDQARSAMTYLEQEQTRLLAQRGRVGAFQARAGYVAQALSSLAEAAKAARSRIVDVDIAGESAHIVKGRILQLAGAAVLAQANRSPALALRLL